MKPLVVEHDVAARYSFGVDAVVEFTETLNGEQWGSRCCGAWSATTLAHHLVGVVGWYDEWLDRALGGTSSPPFPRSDLDRRAAAALVEHAGLTGPEAIALFAERARDYLERARGAWDLPYGYPLGTITTGLHIGVAACEWHLHAWDFSGLADDRHIPNREAADARLLYLASGDAIAATKHAPARWYTRAVLRGTADARPWTTIVRRSGRRT